MNRISNAAGLFARQKATIKIKEIVSATWGRIKRSMFLVLIAAVVATLSSCDKETKGQIAQSKKNDSATAVPDGVNKPKVNIKVNKRYDDKGNLVGFDSTYSSFYSSAGKDTARMDSLMSGFDKYFKQNHSLLFDRQFSPLFFNDSLRYPDFFHNDFFMKRYELNDQYMRESMKKMDSIKNRYFFDQSKKGKKDPKDL